MATSVGQIFFLFLPLSASSRLWWDLGLMAPESSNPFHPLHPTKDWGGGAQKEMGSGKEVKNAE